MKWPINLVGIVKVGCDSVDVVTQDGEYLGIWELDENDHPSFTPDGVTEPLFFDLFVPMLSRRLEEWRKSKSVINL